jgi:1-phosphofructokinase family hexose kinase
MTGPTIVCVSANPAIDRRLRVPRLSVGEINRATSVHDYAGGKAAHVAMAVRALAGQAAWIGFLGGIIGQECQRQMEALGIQVVPIATAASTRVNLEVIDDAGGVTEILEPGTEPAAAERQSFSREFARRIANEWKGALVVISGSLPPGLGPDFYVDLIEVAKGAGATVFLDTSADALRGSVKAKPDFLKANRVEAETLVGRPLKTIEEVIDGAREILQKGLRSAAITLGREGLIWLESSRGPLWMARPPRVNVISTVGCGDATLGGFACATVQGLAGETALRLAAACGAANCVAFAPGRIEAATVHSLALQIEVQRREL